MTKYQRRIRQYTWFAAAALFLTLFLPILQEEWEYPTRALAMLLSGNYLDTMTYRPVAHLSFKVLTLYHRPPLLSWLMIGLSQVTGLAHILIASRLINATATVLTAWLLYKLVAKLSKNNHTAYLAVATYFSWALLIKLGWLAYADTLMSLGVMLSFYGLWLGIEYRQNQYFVLSTAGVIIGFMSKALVPYGAYGILGLVLLCLHPNRKFFFNPISIILGLFALAYPFIWGHFASTNYFPMMWSTLTDGENNYNLLKHLSDVPLYLKQIFIAQPLGFIVAVFPMGLFAIYQAIFKRNTEEKNNSSAIALWSFVILFIPCWLTWRQWPETRYYLPFLPLFCIWAAYALTNLNEKQQKWSLRFLGFMVFAKLLSVVGFYVFYNNFRLKTDPIANNIISYTQKSPISMETKAPCDWNDLLTYSLSRALMPISMMPLKPKPTDKLRYLVCVVHKDKPAPQLTSDETWVNTYGNDHTLHKVYLIKQAVVLKNIMVSPNAKNLRINQIQKN